MGRKKNKKKQARRPQQSQAGGDRSDSQATCERRTAEEDVSAADLSTYSFNSEERTVIFNGPVHSVSVGDQVHHHYGSTSTDAGSASGGQIIDQEMEITADIGPAIRETSGAPGKGSDKITQRVMQLVAKYHNPEKWQECDSICRELSSLFKQNGAHIQSVRFDSIHFYVLVRTTSDEDRFLRACHDGSLAKDLTKLLVVPDLEREAGVKLEVMLTINHQAPAQTGIKEPPPADESFQGEGKSSKPKIESMSPRDIKEWLIHQVKIPVSIAKKIEEEYIDGALLARYEASHLQKDLNLPAGIMRKIFYAIDDMTQRPTDVSSQQSYETLQSVENPDELAGIAHEFENLEVSTASSQETCCLSAMKGFEEEVQNDKVRSPRDTQEESIASSNSKASSKPVLSKEEKSAAEAKLRFLFTGDELGTLDSSFHPLLVVNKPHSDFSKDDETKTAQEKLQENYSFASLINWNAVFDCNSRSLQNGLCSMVQDKRDVKLLLPDTYSKEVSPEEIEFNDVPAWIFANGREDEVELQSPSLDLEWNEKYGADVDRAIDFYATSAVPKDRAVVVFLLLSDDNIEIMSDIFKKFQSSLQGKGSFTFLVDNKELYETWAAAVKKWLSRDQLDKRSFVGADWAHINHYIVNQLGELGTTTAELPTSKGRQCVLPDRVRSTWLNLEVLPSNECENTAMDEESIDFGNFAASKELAFYQGNAVSWWNYYLTEGKMRHRKGFNQVLRRDATNKLHSMVQEKLKSPKEGTNAIVTITAFHEPGSGGSTCMRQVLWDFHRIIRCVVVSRSIMPTVKEILNVRKFGYAGDEKNIPPVLVLIDDSAEDTIDLIAQLERATWDNEFVTCIILHCKRTSEPTEMANRNGINSVVIEHKLSRREREWFVNKFKDYEEEYGETPEKLIGFMVMKEECNPDYISRMLANVLPEVAEKEAKLLKYLAAVNMFIEDFGIPVSCCDEFMTVHTSSKAQGMWRWTNVPWENLLSNAIRLLLIQTSIHTKAGPTKAIKLVSPVIAAEIVKQLVEDRGEKIGDTIRELINDSLILDSKAFIKKYMTDKIRELLVRRKRDMGELTHFAPLIEYLLSTDKSMAFQLLEETAKKFQNGIIAQQLARLYLAKKNFDEAECYAKLAIDYLPGNSFFWDTRGRIIIPQMKEFKKIHGDSPLTNNDIEKLLGLLSDGMAVFRKCQDLKRPEDIQYSAYAALCGELKVIFLFLHILEQCVHIFSRSQENMRMFFLTDEEIPGLDIMWKQKQKNLKKLPKRVEVTIGHINDLTVASRSMTWTKQIGADELHINNQMEAFYEDYLKYFSIDEKFTPPQSVQQSPENMCEWRRAQVRAMSADSFHAIFRYAQNGEIRHLEKIRELIQKNQPKSKFDLQILTFISFAMATVSEIDVDYGSVVKQVKKLEGSLYSAFFTMVLAWPREDTASASSSIGTTTQKAIVNMREKWNELQHKGRERHDSQSSYDRSLPRHQSIRRKALTHFLLAKGQGLKTFVHINMFHASQSTLEEERHKFWARREVQEKLVRLQGIIKDRDMLSYKTPANEVIYIRYSSRTRIQPSQNRVSFCLGFSFAGPRAFDVTLVDQTSVRLQKSADDQRTSIPMRVKDHRETYPGYLVEPLNQLHARKEELDLALDEINYLTKHRRNRQQLSVEDRQLIQSRPKFEKELEEVESKIKEEIDSYDDDDDVGFILVTKGRKGRSKGMSFF